MARHRSRKILKSRRRSGMLILFSKPKLVPKSMQQQKQTIVASRDDPTNPFKSLERDREREATLIKNAPARTRIPELLALESAWWAVTTLLAQPQTRKNRQKRILLAGCNRKSDKRRINVTQMTRVTHQGYRFMRGSSPEPRGHWIRSTLAQFPTFQRGSSKNVRTKFIYLQNSPATLPRLSRAYSEIETMED